MSAPVASASAAHGALIHFDQKQPGDVSQEAARRAGYTLGVSQMARFLIRHGCLNSPDARIELQCVEQLDNVADARAKPLGTIGPIRLVGQQLSVFFEI